MAVPGDDSVGVRADGWIAGFGHGWWPVAWGFSGFAGHHSLRRAGPAIIASAGTAIASLLALAVAGFALLFIANRPAQYRVMELGSPPPGQRLGIMAVCRSPLMYRT